MNFDIEFFQVIGKNNIVMQKKEEDLPLIYKDVASIYVVDKNLYLVPSIFNDDEFNNLLSLKLYIEGLNKYNRVYIFIPKIFKEYESILKKSKINFLNYKSEEYFYYTKQLLHNTDSNIKIKYTKSTQIVFKYLILKKIKKTSVREISKATNLSISTVSVALFTLYKLNVVELVGENTSSYYILHNRRRAFEILNKYFIYPIKESGYMLMNDNQRNYLLSKYKLSSESAFEEYTDLSKITETTQIAVLSSEYNKIIEELHNIKDSDNKSSYLFEIQMFIYNPNIFSNNNFIDKFDTYLLLLFKTNKDSRETDAFRLLGRQLMND